MSAFLRFSAFVSLLTLFAFTACKQKQNLPAGITPVKNASGKGKLTSNVSGAALAADPLIVKKCNDFEIDGKGSNSEWNKTDWQMFTKMTADGIQFVTKSKILYSPTGIYMLFYGDDKKITTKDYPDNGEIYDGDVFEVFFHPNPSLPQYFEYEINPLQKELTLTLARTKGATVSWIPWQHEYKGKVKIKSKVNINGGKPQIGSPLTSWTAEVFFPNHVLGLLPVTPPKSGDVWNANFCRIDYDSGKPSEWSWSPTIGPSFHELEQFRSIKFE